MQALLRKFNPTLGFCQALWERSTYWSQTAAFHLIWRSREVLHKMTNIWKKCLKAIFGFWFLDTDSYSKYCLFLHRIVAGFALQLCEHESLLDSHSLRVCMYPLPKYACMGLVQMSIKGNAIFSMQLKNKGKQLYLSRLSFMYVI